jgi:hypothetical protein
MWGLPGPRDGRLVGRGWVRSRNNRPRQQASLFPISQIPSTGPAEMAGFPLRRPEVAQRGRPIFLTNGLISESLWPVSSRACAYLERV